MFKRFFPARQAQNHKMELRVTQAVIGEHAGVIIIIGPQGLGTCPSWDLIKAWFIVLYACGAWFPVRDDDGMTFGMIRTGEYSAYR
jgi:hypothetical protein